MEDPVNIAGKDYKFAELPEKAQKMLTFIQTIDNNLNSLDTQMEMMQITREGCYNKLMTEIHDVEKEAKPAA